MINSQGVGMSEDSVLTSQEAAPVKAQVLKPKRTAPVEQPRSTKPVNLAVIVIAAVGILAGGVYGIVKYQPSWLSSVPGFAKTAKTEPVAIKAGKVLATVNGQPIYAQELLLDTAGKENQSSYAEQLDRYVQVLVLADAAKKLPESDELKGALAYAERSVLANYWLMETNKQMAKSVTAAEIQAFYDKELSDDLFTTYRVAYYATPDQADATNVLKLINEAKAAGTAIPAELASKFTVVKVQAKDKEGKVSEQEYLPPTMLPYGFGNIVGTLKAGDYTQSVLATREGYFILQLVDRKKNPKPALKEVEAQIKAQIVSEKVAKAGLVEREKADIRNK